MTDTDPIDDIAEALALLRDRRGPRPPWAGGGPFGDPGSFAHGDHRHHDHDEHPHGPDHGFDLRHGFGHGGPAPWGGHHRRGRFGGPARFRLLEALAAAEAALTVGELAERIGVDQPRASRVVQQAVAAGWVRREADPADARRTRVALTDGGRRFAAGLRGDRRTAVETALAGFSDEERVLLARLLSRLAADWPRD